MVGLRRAGVRGRALSAQPVEETAILNARTMPYGDTTQASMRALPLRSAADNPPIPKSQVWLLAFLMFSLAAGNAQPIWWSSLAPALLTSVIFFARRSPSGLIASAFSPRNRVFTFLILLIDLSSIVSTAVNMSYASAVECLTRCIAPLLLYLSIVDIRIRASDVRPLIWGFALGAAVIFGRGLIAFYAEWGNFDFDTLLWARYNLFRMTPYMVATLGNVSHMGVYVALMGPFFLAAAVLLKLGRSTTLMMWSTIALTILNAVIAGSRTAFIVFALSVVVVIARLGARGVIIFATMAVVAGLLAAQQGLDAVSQQALIERYLPSASQTGVDASAIERFMSIQIGIDVFLQHPIFGIGPGLSGDYNPWDIPHESLVYVASEIGLFGGVAFAMLNLAIIAKMAVATFSTNSADARWKLLWLIGPAHWCIFGLFGGTIFNMSVALLWVGIIHAMLALSNATVVADAP